ncbi:MAG: hypothetical protein ACLGH8_15005 [Bacteroidia bacterium]
MARAYLLYEIEYLISQKIASREADPKGDDLTLTALHEQANQFKVALADAVFRLRKHNQLCLLIEKYHTALILLIDEVLEISTQNKNLEGCFTILNELLLFIEKRFPQYLKPDNELPPNYISLSKKEWPARLQAMEAHFFQAGAGDLYNFIKNNLLRFVNARRHKHLPLKALLYRKELISEMEHLQQSPKMLRLPASLHELLVYSNYNSRGYLEYYTREISLYAKGKEEGDIIKHLKRQYEKFLRLYCNTGMALHPGKDSIKVMIINWYEGQLLLLSQGKIKAVMPYGKALKGLITLARVKLLPRVICILSANQLGILLRAADQAGIIKAPSLSAVFKAIVPHLSTPRTPELSPDSVRSKSYLFDEKDRDSLIVILEQLIEKIRKL